MQETDIQAPTKTPPEPESRHWTWPTLAVVAVLALTVAGAIGWWLRSNDDDGAAETPEIVEQWGDAFVAGDWGAMTELYAENGVFDCRAFDFDVTGRDAIESVLPDDTDFTAFEPRAVLVGDEIIAVEYMVSATSPSGQLISTPLLAVFDVDASGLIDRSTIDYDPVAMFPG